MRRRNDIFDKLFVILFALLFLVVIISMSKELCKAETINNNLYAGVTDQLFKTLNGDYEIEVEVEETEIVKESLEDEIDITCWKKYSVKQFKRLGRVYYGGYSYTWYSEKVLPGGGLKIPGRHHNGIGFIVDKDGYICTASDDLTKGTIINTPVGIKGKIYDCGSGKGNLDLYVYW